MSEAAPFDPYALYRYFDVRDIELYVGISGDLAVRDGSHISRSRWMQLTARSTVERHPTLEDAKKAEKEAIEAERPIFNKQYNSTPEARARLHAYLEDIGRLDWLYPEPNPAAHAPEADRLSPPPVPARPLEPACDGSSQVGCPACDTWTDLADFAAGGAVQHDGHGLVLVTTRMGRTVCYVIEPAA